MLQPELFPPTGDATFTIHCFTVTHRRVTVLIQRRLKNDPCRQAWPEMYDWRGFAEVVNLIEPSLIIQIESSQIIYFYDQNDFCSKWSANNNLSS